MSAPAPISVLIPVRNEAANLPACLASVAWCDDIVVVDSGSTDATARRSPAPPGRAWWTKPWNGRLRRGKRTGR